ncbi:MAG: HPP family protein [Acidobacteria bacterium]|nr:MAG: HPP family protein [Acidobacteriota bacterium]
MRLLEPAVVPVLLRRLRLTSLLGRFPARPIWAAFVFINGFLSLGIMALVGMLMHTPDIFPSLGPTAFLFFFTPDSPTASPRNTIYGHAIGIACGYFTLVVFGLTHAPPATQVMGFHRLLAASLSLALTGALMILLKAAHPPAGATTLIVSLGIVTRPFYLLVIELAVAALTLQAIVINRLAGLDYPLWAPREALSTGPAGPAGKSPSAQ